MSKTNTIKLDGDDNAFVSIRSGYKTVTVEVDARTKYGKGKSHKVKFKLNLDQLEAFVFEAKALSEKQKNAAIQQYKRIHSQP